MAMASIDDFGIYTHAIVCGIPNSFVHAIGSDERIDLHQVRKEHAQYVQNLKSMGLQVIQMWPDENFPDCPFVEDTAIICNGQALITTPGHPGRRYETKHIRKVLRDQLQIPIKDITDFAATIDGSDVLFTGQEFFVGLSDRTNLNGATFLAKTFPEFSTTPICLPPGVYNLKSVVSMAGPGLICCAQCKGSQDIIRKIEREASGRYQTVTVPDAAASNCVYANGRLMHRAEFPLSLKAFEQKLTCPRLPICVYNLTKPQAFLSCMSLLLKK